MIDLLVVGGGPVGVYSAICAAQSGLTVTVVDSQEGTIDKACGEGLMPDALKALTQIGVNPAGIDFFGIRYIAGDHQAEARFSNGPGRGVRRTALHKALRDKALDLNIDFVHARVSEITQNHSSIMAAGIESRYLIGADGLHSTVRRAANLEVKPGSEGRMKKRFGLRQHFKVCPWSDLVEVYWRHDVEIYVTPVDRETVGVAVLGNAILDFNDVLKRVPQLARRLEGAAPASKLQGAGPLHQRVRARTSGRLLLVGDAAGYVDALTGEGLKIGFAEAQAAVRAITQNDIESYEQEWKKITRSYRWLTGGLLYASSSKTIRKIIVPAAQYLPSVFHRLVNLL